MIRRVCLLTLLTILVGLLNITPSWGGPPNPTASDANFNTAGGSGALFDVTTGGVSNTAFGFYALRYNTSGDNNTAFGDAALLSNTTGSYNTAIGLDALFSNINGFHNTASGAGALQNNTTGGLNTASGAGALSSNTSGGANTATGSGALTSNITGTNNAAVGVNALAHNDANYNTATGSGALFDNTSGSNNTANGFQALLSNSTGGNNTAIGSNALFASSTGIRNTAVGDRALTNSTGNSSKNIAIGYRAGAALTSGSNNIYLGNPGISSESFTMRLGTVQTSTFIAGINTAGISGTPVVIDGNGQVGVSVSSARYKRNIEAMASRSEDLLKLRPVTFAYRDDGAATMRYGLIAEEVAAVYPELVIHAASGEVHTVKYLELIPMLLNELQRQQQTLQSQAQALERQERAMTEVAALWKELTELRALVGQRHEAHAAE